MSGSRPAVLVLVFLMILALSGSSLAQGERSAIFILNPSARSAGMGGGGVADYTDAANVYFNPANCAFLDKVYVNGFYGKLVPDLANDVYFLNTGVSGAMLVSSDEDVDVSIGTSVRFGYLSYGDWEATSPSGENLGTASSHETYLSLTLTGGLTIGDRIRGGLGLSIKPVWINLAPSWATLEGTEGNGHTLAFDVGLVMSADIIKEEAITITPTAGVSLLNFGSSITFDNRDQAASLPKNLHFGGGIIVSILSEEFANSLGKDTPLVRVAAFFDMMDDQTVSDSDLIKSYGCEIALLKMLFLRVGKHDDERGHIKDWTYGVGAGISTAMFSVRFDYAKFPQSSDLESVDKYDVAMGIKF